MLGIGKTGQCHCAVPFSYIVKEPAVLALADGTIFQGQSIGACGRAAGEVVFNTAMTGYQEILTDPSYARQIITFTYPHIGNTGINEEDWESDDIQVAGLVLRDIPIRVSSYRSQGRLEDLLRERGIVGIAGVDTRSLTRRLQRQGVIGGCLAAGPDCSSEEALEAARGFPGLSGMDLVQEVTAPAPYPWEEGGWQPGLGFRASGQTRFHVVAYDFGVKRDILRLLADRHCRLTVVPATTGVQEVLNLKPDGVFLSNGPGDPEPCTYAISAIRELLETGLPIFGICLGHQLLALACGARTVKMKFGHHGANHPVQDLKRGNVLITSQNHGFAVEEDSLPANLQATHRSLFDGSLQGLRHREQPAFGFQGHPEASPGPHDAVPLFDDFIALMDAYQREGGDAKAH